MKLWVLNKENKFEMFKNIIFIIIIDIVIFLN